MNNVLCILVKCAVVAVVMVASQANAKDQKETSNEPSK